MFSQLAATAFHLPEGVLTNSQLAEEFGDWDEEKIVSKTGIVERRIVGEGEYCSDLATKAGEALFESGACQADEVQYLILCTQSPDYVLPSTSCLVQERLGIPTSAGALDINQGCSGYIYGLSLACGLIDSGIVENVLLITADTYTRYINKRDRSVRTLFGDGATATWLKAGSEQRRLGPFVFGTDGRGRDNLIVPAGGLKQPCNEETGRVEEVESGNFRCADNLYMNGAEIFNFTLRTVPAALNSLLEKAGLGMDDIDQFVFHQANKFMLERLRRKLNILQDKFVIGMQLTGNTVSSTIPIALQQATESGRIKSGDVVVLLGFGVGYSWGGTILRV